MRTVPVAQLRMRYRAWYIDLTYTFPNRKRHFTIGPLMFDQGKHMMEAGHEHGRWIKEGIGDR